jgi:cell division protein FtsN
MFRICNAPAAIHEEVWSLTLDVGQSGGFFGGLFGGGGKEESPSPEKAVQPPAEEAPAAEPVSVGTPAKEEEKPREESPAFETPASTPAKPKQEQEQEQGQQEQEQDQGQQEQVAEQPAAAAEEARNVAGEEEQVASKPTTPAASKPVKQPKKASGGSCQVCLSHSDCGEDAFTPSSLLNCTMRSHVCACVSGIVYMQPPPP